MKYTHEMEEMIVTQIEREPEREVILPDWCYWKGTGAVYIHRDGERVRLVQHLYESLIGALPRGVGLAPRPGTSPRNVNPHLYVIVPTPGARPQCPNRHPYTEEDWVPGVGHQCQACRAAKRNGKPSPIDINRAKTHCPKGHVLVKRKNNTRRCYECPRRQSQEYRKRVKESA
jgi:hypothetical protein